MSVPVALDIHSSSSYSSVVPLWSKSAIDGREESSDLGGKKPAWTQPSWLLAQHLGT